MSCNLESSCTHDCGTGTMGRGGRGYSIRPRGHGPAWLRALVMVGRRLVEGYLSQNHHRLKTMSFITLGIPPS